MRIIAEWHRQWIVALCSAAVRAVIFHANCAVRCPLHGVAVPGLPLCGEEDIAVAKTGLRRLAARREGTEGLNA